MKIEGDDVIFSTGHIRYANNGIIGIDPEGEVSDGYDGGFEASNEGREMTREEKIELADYMIERWQRYKDNG